MTDPLENLDSPYAPPLVSSCAEEVPLGMEPVADDRELAAYLKIRRQTPLSCLLCLGAVAFWTSFVSVLIGVLAFAIPPPERLALPIYATVAALAASALTSVPLVGAAAVRPRHRLALCTRGLSTLFVALAIAVALWGTVAIVFDGIWRETIGILFWTAPLWFFLPFGLIAIWVNRFAARRLVAAGISEHAIALKGGRIYDFRE